ncbi:hypothetical protein [Microbulbifer sp. 2201CG32-9]|uniref:hypothetical protein n=1 Tax=unclassified Microbulbifer TaxID=2619833 RepID=UPI00345B8869
MKKLLLPLIILLLIIGYFMSRGGDHKAKDAYDSMDQPSSESMEEKSAPLDTETPPDSDSSRMMDKTKDAMRDTGSALKDAARDTGSAVEDAADKTGDALKDVGDAAKKGVDDVEDAAGKAADEIRGKDFTEEMKKEDEEMQNEDMQKDEPQN